MKGQSVAIVGSGSVGLYYGGKLSADGHDVRFLLRSGYDEAVREGLRIFSPSGGDIRLPRAAIYHDPADIGPVDWVIVALKATANDALPRLVAPLLHETTALLTLQNGLGGDAELARHFGPGRVLGGLCFVCLTRRSPAAVDHIGHGTLSIGEFGRPAAPRTQAIVDAFRATGIDARVVDDLANERWRKLAWNIPFNGLAVAAGNKTTDQILADPALHAECRALMEEVIATANALGLPIEASYADYHIQRTYPMGAYVPSTLVDWRAGQELEIEPIWGEPLRQAAAAGIPMPHLQRLYERLREMATGR